MQTETLIAGVEHATQQVSMSITLFFTGLLILMIVCLALEEKIHAKKSLIVGIFATIALLAGGFMHILFFGHVTLSGGTNRNARVHPRSGLGGHCHHIRLPRVSGVEKCH